MILKAHRMLQFDPGQCSRLQKHNEHWVQRGAVAKQQGHGAVAGKDLQVQGQATKWPSRYGSGSGLWRVTRARHQQSSPGKVFFQTEGVSGFILGHALSARSSGMFKNLKPTIKTEITGVCVCVGGPLGNIDISSIHRVILHVCCAISKASQIHWFKYM